MNPLEFFRRGGRTALGTGRESLSALSNDVGFESLGPRSTKYPATPFIWFLGSWSQPVPEVHFFDDAWPRVAALVVHSSPPRPWLMRKTWPSGWRTWNSRTPQASSVGGQVISRPCSWQWR